MIRRRLHTLTAVVLAAVLAGCGAGKDRPPAATDGDTGAAAPATQQSLSPTPSMGDTTAAASHTPGAAAAAGDTLGAAGKAAGQPTPPTKRP